MRIVVQNDKKLSKISTLVVADDREDMNEVLLAQGTGQRGHGLHEGHGHGLGTGRSRWYDHNGRTRVVMLHVEGGSCKYLTTEFKNLKLIIMRLS